MTERNMLREGFMFNTLDNEGTVSGTQVVTIPQLDLLVDGDVSSTALSTEIGNFFSIDADMGARWKLNRLELHTAETQPLNFEMSISEDGSDFQEVTMTGSAPLYVGDIPESVVSGAPRYVRYRHAGAAIRDVYEWQAVADDTLVNFGEDGTQTSTDITDAPIGRPSDEITTLTLRNDYDKAATGFVVIESEGTGADNIEIALSPNGPWFGRTTLDAGMPNLTSFTAGSFGASETTLASGMAYSTSRLWNDGLSGGWSSTGFTQHAVSQGRFTVVNSTATSPTIQADNDFSPTDVGFQTVDSPDSPVRGNFFAFRPDLYDKVRVMLSTTTIPAADLVEGVRLFWRTHDTDSYTLDKSVLSTASGSNFTGQPQEFIFDVGALPTWSGVVRSLQVRPWVTATGVGKTVTLHNVEVYNEGLQDRVILPLAPTTSGQMSNITGGTPDTVYNTIINTDNKITEPCIISSVSVEAIPRGTVSSIVCGIALLRIVDFANLPPYSEPSVPGNNFEVKRFVLIPDDTTTITSDPSVLTQTVWWPAEPDDMLAFTWSFVGGDNVAIGYGDQQAEDPTRSGVDGGALVHTAVTSVLSTSATSQDITDEWNARSNWEAINDRKYALSWKAISAGPYISNGTFSTNIIDGGGDPALLSLDFSSRQESGSSIDVFTAAAPAQTVEAQASARPPDVSTSTARARNWDDGARTLPGVVSPTIRKGYRYSEEPIYESLGAFWLGMHPMGGRGIPGLRYNARSPEFISDWNIGFQNPAAETREQANNNASSIDQNRKIENIGRLAFHHETNDEMWILNLMVSGTSSADARPIWDVYTPDQGVYLRTEHMKGTINYTYNNETAAVVAGPWTFEPVGFIPDYEREEIYIISRTSQFHVGAGDYMGVVMDLQGNYKSVFFRQDIIFTDMEDAGISAGDRIDLLLFMQNMTYDGTYFYAVTTRTGSTRGRRDRMIFFRLADSESTAPLGVNFVSEVNLLSVPGNEIDIGDNEAGPQAIAYSSSDGLTYYLQRASPTKLDTWVISILGESPNETVTVSQGPVTQSTSPFFTTPELYLDGGFSQRSAGTLAAWAGNGFQQDLSNIADLSYSSTRDSLWVVNTLRSECSKDLVMHGESQTSVYYFRLRNHTALQEIGPESIPITDQPGHPNFTDVVWGTTSGTLQYDAIQDNSVLFPTGRYARVRYTLNSSPDGFVTPELLTSQITQGLRVGEIAPAGTRDIYMRTNIPEGTSIGDQSGSLKVFWQLEE